MQRRADYTLVGVFVIFLTVIMFALFFWLTAQRHDQKYVDYRVYFNEGVTGLQRQSLVRFNGVLVGFVKQIKLDHSNPQLVDVLLSIVDGTPVTTSTVASLTMQGITGSVYVELKTSKKKAPLLIAKAGQPYPVIPSNPSLLGQLSQALPNLVASLDSVSHSVKLLVNEKNRIAISDSLENAKVFTGALAASSKDLEKSIAKLRVTLKNTAVASQALPGALQSLQKTLHEIKRAASHIALATKGVGTMTRSANTVLENFSQQVLPTVQQTVSNMSSLVNSVQELSKKLNRNPSILIRGQQPPQPGPGE